MTQGDNDMINYVPLKQQLTDETTLMKKQSITYSIMRMSSAILFILFIWLAQNNTIFYGISFLFLVLFLILVYVHDKHKNRIVFKETQLEIIAKLENRYEDAWKKEELAMHTSNDPILNDLDILGKQSLVNYLDMSGTLTGLKYLQSLFENTSKKEDIIKRQEAIQELLNNPLILLELQTHSALFHKHSKKVKKETIDELIQHAKVNIKQPTFLMGLSLLMVGITIVFIILTFMTTWAVNYLFILISLNIIIVLLQFTKNNVVLAEVSVVKDVLEDYLEFMEYVDTTEFHNPYLKSLQQQNKEGLKGIKELLVISLMTKLRANLITNFIFNGIFQIDIFIVRKLAIWKKLYGSDLEKWFMTIAQIEALTSISVIGQVKETYCFPDILDDKEPHMKFEYVCHPLIAESKAVPNNMVLQNNTYIITGSNMSGKTTFLRTLGVNAKLALLGAPVCAKRCEISLMDIYTSMRIKDDVNEGISTFYAELLSIKAMMDASKKEQPILVLIDEIFKGTNSADRILCAKEAICRLHLPWVITLVSTHDFELCALDQDKNINAQNYHFEEYYDHDEIHFDYLLKNGKCTTTNAKELMRLAGF